MAYYQQGPVNPSLPTSYGQPPQQQQQTNFQPPTPTIENSKIGYYIAAGIFTIIFLMALGIIPNPLASETVTGTGSGSGSGSTGSSSTRSGSTGSGSTSDPAKPKVYNLAPIYYSEKFGDGITAFGGKMGSPYTVNTSCPAGTSLIKSTTGPNGPQVGYYAHSLNKKSPYGKPYPASCATSMIKGNKQKIGDKTVDASNLSSYATIGLDGSVVINNSKLNKLWGDPCGGYYKTLELGLSCAKDGIDPGADAEIVAYTPTAGFVSRMISRY